ncbi:type II toxin-antitoxin system Phd/YefM family antitoxin [Methylotenera sp.]|uniref:type II toxin-antitoxin system Phd/YefM family antitoxin n=1 Tax=Methylotenera sp. TaxID=2051956 RepID=UPI00271D17D7|nr:type II toxin-antitoxin system prevent-host-death family antitoxin [Methylotenera sp.]MDO9394665.1 type II toxin-antitoxin system prevent-host-death family antitoxin [Methylotenera sp.]MDP2071946.1 type II toxin-antitoxin system prevent-host-death family antitoxin [Methylotenera sp.]MDP3005571.1 type II toxin-antitoxin system prevent-host-death family antitoxin [Methylotenera sp.]MDP3308931.1 type II toxin-antitoxin system prevent-host-death family antitoxin [Methylotenera sp.]
MQVSIQEFKSHLSHYVGQAQSGQLIELTSHRKVVARIVGVPSTASAGVSSLLAAGVAAWQGGKPMGASLSLQKRGKLVSALVLEDRG